MATARYHKVKIGEHELNAETLMLGYGYDPSLSEGSVKPPVFLTSTFVFQTAEQGRDFFDYLAGRRAPPVEGQTGLVYSRFNHPNLEIVEDRLAIHEKAASGCVQRQHLEPRDRIGVRLREDGFVEPADFQPRTTYLVDLELWDLGDRGLRERKLGQIVAYIEARDSEVLDQYLGPSITMARVRLQGKLLQTLLRTGAANFSASGLKRQDNDLIVIESAEAAAAFKRTFEARFASGEALPIGPGQDSNFKHY